jgi:hypothetical protein
VDLPSCVVLDPSSAKSTGVKGLVVLTRGRAQLHSLCFCEGFFGIPAIWQFQVLGRILAFCRSFRRGTIVMSCRIRATRCMVAENFFKTNRLMVVRHSPGIIRDARSHLGHNDRTSGSGRFCCKSRLRQAANRDSVVVTRFSARSIHDGPSEE